eukprot:scaffold41733_cov55-Phaeocystis_antarctica.AAC.2
MEPSSHPSYKPPFDGRTASSRCNMLQRRRIAEFCPSIGGPSPSFPRKPIAAKACPAGHALSSRATTPAHDHATSQLHAHAHSTPCHGPALPRRAILPAL